MLSSQGRMIERGKMRLEISVAGHMSTFVLPLHRSRVMAALRWCCTLWPALENAWNGHLMVPTDRRDNWHSQCYHPNSLEPNGAPARGRLFLGVRITDASAHGNVCVPWNAGWGFTSKMLWILSSVDLQ